MFFVELLKQLHAFEQRCLLSGQTLLKI